MYKNICTIVRDIVKILFFSNIHEVYKSVFQDLFIGTTIS